MSHDMDKMSVRRGRKGWGKKWRRRIRGQVSELRRAGIKEE
jgi:hypothetical protein